MGILGLGFWRSMRLRSDSLETAAAAAAAEQEAHHHHQQQQQTRCTTAV
jgi:hypothetical protein